MNIPIVKTQIIHPIEVATTIELLAKDYLLPPKPGIYAKGSTESILLDGVVYYKRGVDDNGKMIELPIRNVEDITADVYNQDSELVLPIKYKQHFSTEPTVPSRGLKIVSSFVQKYLDDNSAWSRKSPVSLETLWSDVIRPEYLQTSMTVDLVEEIASLLVDIRTDVQQFIGNDKWVMHFMRQRSNDIFIEKSTDYRIYQWSIEHQMELGSDYKL